MAISGCGPWIRTQTNGCALKPPHIVTQLHLSEYTLPCTWKTHANKHPQQFYLMCNGAIIPINMLNTIIWISHCMFITHSTNTKRGGNTKEFTWGKYMWKQSYCRCYKGATAVAPSLTEIQWFCIQWHLFLVTRTCITYLLITSEWQQYLHPYNSKPYKSEADKDETLYVSKAE